MGYFESFYARTQPLGSLSKIYAKLGDFEARFKAGEISGWADKGSANGDVAAAGLDMTAFATVEEVESLGESLKDTLCQHCCVHIWASLVLLIFLSPAVGQPYQPIAPRISPTAPPGKGSEGTGCAPVVLLRCHQRLV